VYVCEQYLVTLLDRTFIAHVVTFWQFSLAY
jgi:hypothetical protein